MNMFFFNVMIATCCRSPTVSDGVVRLRSVHHGARSYLYCTDGDFPDDATRRMMKVWCEAPTRDIASKAVFEVVII